MAQLWFSVIISIFFIYYQYFFIFIDDSVEIPSLIDNIIKDTSKLYSPSPENFKLMEVCFLLLLVELFFLRSTLLHGDFLLIKNE